LPYSEIYDLILPFNWNTWIFFLIATFTVGVFYIWVIAKVKDFASLNDGPLLFTISLVLMKSANSVQKSQSNSFRVATFLIMLSFFVISAAYSSVLISFFTVDVYPKRPETISEVIDYIKKEDLDVRICCNHIRAAVDDAKQGSFLKLKKKVIKEGFLTR